MSYNLKKKHRPHTSQSKGNGSKRGRIDGGNFRPNNIGVNYRGGMGCSRHHNCFTCPFIKDCKFDAQGEDAKFLKARGDGIVVGASPNYWIT